MARDWRRIIAALEAKAADRACAPAEADALQAKAAALRETHGFGPEQPVTAPQGEQRVWVQGAGFANGVVVFTGTATTSTAFGTGTITVTWG